MYIIKSMRRGGNQPEQYIALRDHRIDYHRTEDVVILSQVEDQVGGLHQSSVHIHRCYRRFCFPNVKSVFFQTCLKCIYNFPQLGS